MGKSTPILLCLAMLFLVSCSAQEPGCTDPLANNFDPRASINDGSCIYNSAAVSPLTTLSLNELLNETSGLILWDGFLWTHNDDTDTRIYQLDKNQANIIKQYELKGVVNRDWEEISQDENYIYLGDFGNNGSGNREDLHLLRIEKHSLPSGNAIIDTIWFSYSDQLDFAAQPPNQTEFDCEAFIVSYDSIYLFTKQWLSGQTSVYSLPKVPGRHLAKSIDHYDIQGLVTGATYMDSLNLLALCGYNSLLQPFIFLLYDFEDFRFFSGNKRKLSVNLPFHQVEGLATDDGLIYFLSNEAIVFQEAVNIQQALHLFDLNPFLQTYVNERE
jgi:hypothetical protein